MIADYWLQVWFIMDDGNWKMGDEQEGSLPGTI
jgi:hypothetical protein